jgi:hypothetical protein
LTRETLKLGLEIMDDKNLNESFETESVTWAVNGILE